MTELSRHVLPIITYHNHFHDGDYFMLFVINKAFLLGFSFVP